MIETKIRSSAPTEFIVQEPPLDFTQAHAEYIANGGQLDPESFRFISEFAQSDETDTLLAHRSFTASKHQATHMETFTGVGLSPVEHQLYALLRNQYIPDELPENSGCRPQSLSDQSLMAEILRLTAPEKMQLFMSNYEHIFDRK